MVCGRHGHCLWPSWLWPSWSLFVTIMVVAVMVIVCGHHGLWPSWLWPSLFVAIMVCGRHCRTPRLQVTWFHFWACDFIVLSRKFIDRCWKNRTRDATRHRATRWHLTSLQQPCQSWCHRLWDRSLICQAPQHTTRDCWQRRTTESVVDTTRYSPMYTPTARQTRQTE